MGSPWWQPGLLFQWKVTKVRIGTIPPDLGDLTLGTAFHLSVDDWDDWGFSKCSSASLHFNNSWFNHESAICCAGTSASLLDVRCPTQSQPSRLGPKASIRRLFYGHLEFNLLAYHQQRYWRVLSVSFPWGSTWWRNRQKLAATGGAVAKFLVKLAAPDLVNNLQDHQAIYLSNRTYQLTEIGLRLPSKKPRKWV